VSHFDSKVLLAEWLVAPGPQICIRQSRALGVSSSYDGAREIHIPLQ